MTSLWTPAEAEREAPVAAAAAEVSGVSLSLAGTHNLAAPGWDGLTQPRGNNGDLAVLDNANGRTAFVAAGPRFHGLWSVTAGRVCTDHGGVKVVDLNSLASPAGIINIEDFKGVISGPTGNPRRGLKLTNISSAASSVDAMTFTHGPHAGKDILAIATQRCEQSFFNGARIEFWDVTNRAAPTMLADFNPENILHPTGGTPANGQWGIFEEVRLFSRTVGGVTTHHAVATTPFSIGNGHDASFAGDMRFLNVTDLTVSDTAMQTATFPNGNVNSVTDNGCRTFHGGRSVAPSPDGNRAILSWYDGVLPTHGNFGSSNTAAVMNLDLDNIPTTSGTAFPKVFSPAPPPNWGYPVGAVSGEDGVVEGNAADVEPFNGPAGQLMTFVSEDDNDPALTDFSVTAPASVAAAAPVNDRACSMMVAKRVHQLPNQELLDDAVYVGRACPASALINSTLPQDDPLLADVNGKVAIVETGGNGFDQCGATDKIRRLHQAGATAVLMNLGGDFLSVHIPGIDGDFPAIPAVGIQGSAWNKMAGLVPVAGRLPGANATFPTTWTRSSTTNVTQRPYAAAISAATNASPIVLTTAAHGLATGDRVVVAGVTGNTAANGEFTVTASTATTLTLNGSTGNGAFAGGGSVIACPANGVLPCPTGGSRRTDFGRFRSLANGTDTAARGEVALANRFNVTAGEAYDAGASMEVEEITTAGTGGFRTAVVWYDTGGALIGEDTIQSLSAATARAQYAQTVTAPTGATKAAVKFEWTGGTQGIAHADTFFVTSDGLQVKLKDHAGECAGGTRSYWPPGACSGTAKPEWGQQRILDFSQSPPAQTGTYRSPTSLAWPPPNNGIYAPSQARMFGNLAFTAWHSDGLRVVDMSNPASPREVASFVPPAVADPSGAAGPSNRALPGTGTCDLATDSEPAANVPCMTRNKSFPTVPLVTAVEVIPTGANTGKVVLSDINAGLYVLDFTVNKRATATVDFDADNDSDISIYRPSNGGWYTNDGITTQYGGQSGDIPVPGDYDGDGTTDTAVYRPSVGTWYIHNSLSNTDTLLNYGVSSDIPVPADYDGDGKTDIAIYRPSTPSYPTGGTWYIRNSSNSSDTIVTFGGIQGDIPVVGDYDADGKDDRAIFRPSSGGWFVQQSSGGETSRTYGASGDIPVPGDYDGDAKTDVGVYRPSVGTWYINNSATNTDTLLNYGVSTDQVVPGDYNGDGRSELGVYRPTTPTYSSGGTWYLRNLANGTDTIVTFGGVQDDVPLPLPHAIRRFFYTP